MTGPRSSFDDARDRVALATLESNRRFLALQDAQDAYDAARRELDDAKEALKRAVDEL